MHTLKIATGCVCTCTNYVAVVNFMGRKPRIDLYWLLVVGRQSLHSELTHNTQAIIDSMVYITNIVQVTKSEQTMTNDNMPKGLIN